MQFTIGVRVNDNHFEWVVPEKIHTPPTEEIFAVRRGREENVLGCPKGGERKNVLGCPKGGERNVDMFV
jgi:hypothetical protein